MAGPQHPWAVSVPAVIVAVVERTCHRCPEPTFIIFESKPWCRKHYLAEHDDRDAAKAALETSA